MKKKYLILIVFLSIQIFLTTTLWSDQNGIGQLSQSADKQSREEYIVSSIKYCFTRSNTLQRSAVFFSTKKERQDITFLLKEAALNFDSYSEESRAYLTMFLKRPTDTSNTWPWDSKPLFYLPDDVLVFNPDQGNYPSIGGKFRFWYVTHSTSDGGGVKHTTTLDFVKKMASAFDTVYRQEVTTMGYPAPPEDDDSIMDIYVMNCGAYDVYGYTALDIDSNTNASFMVMDNDYIEFATGSQTAEESMQVTAAHEYHHAIQFGINPSADQWIMEATSTWVEDQVFDSIDDNLQYLVNTSSGFFANPHESLDSEFQWYNNWIWLEYMTTKWGQSSVNSIWTDYLSVSPSGTSAVSKVLLNRNSSLRAAFTEFTKYNYIQEGFYTDHASYIPVDITNAVSQEGYDLDYSSEDSDIFSAQTLTVDHLAARYFKLTPGAAIASGQNDTLTVYLKGAVNRRIDVVPVVKSSGGVFTQKVLNLDASNYGKIEIFDFNQASVSEAVLVIVNYSLDENSTSILISGGIGTDGSENRGGAEPAPDFQLSSGGGGCFIESIN